MKLHQLTQPENGKTGSSKLVSRQYRKFGGNIVRLAALFVVVFAYAPEAKAQEFEACPAGSQAAPGNICVQTCPRNMAFDGYACKKPDDYVRNRFAPLGDNAIKYSGPERGPVRTTDPRPKLIADCNNAKVEEQIRDYSGQGPWQRCYYSENDRGAYPACAPGYRSETEPICTAICPVGFADTGTGGCKPPSYPMKLKEAPRPVEPPAPDLTGWTVCASEGGRCQFEGTAEVRYGVGNKWAILTFNNGVDCNNTVFGDPASGQAKQCLLSPNITPNAPPDINTRDGNGNNDLHLAVSRNDLTAVNDLLNRGIDVNASNNTGETPVTSAAEFGYTQILMALLAHGGDLNAAVNRAIRKDNEGMFRTILAAFPVRMTNADFDLAVSSGAEGIALSSMGLGVEPTHAMNYGVRTKNVIFVDGAMRAGGSPDAALKFALENGHRELAFTALRQFRANPELALNLAIPRNDVQILTAALELGANPNAGMAAAVAGGNEQIVMMLVDRGADPNPAMMLAAKSKNSALISRLLAANADGRKPDLIHAAAAANSAEIVRILVRAGADPRWALAPAIENKNVLLLRELLAANAVVQSQDVLQLAGGSGNREIIDLILLYGGSNKVNLPGMVLGSIEARDFENTKYLLDMGTDLDYNDLLKNAASVGERRISELLIDRGADPTAGMFNAVEKGHVEVVQLLVERKASGSDPKLIEMAASKKNAAIVNLLLTAGADPENGMIAAVGSGSAEIVGALIGKGAKATDPAYILRAVTSGNADLASVLLKGGAPKDVMDATGQPLVIITALALNIHLVEVLLANGVDPNAKNRAGDTALHIIANDEASKGYPKFKKMKKTRLPMVEALIKGGADVNATNAKGETVRKSLGGGDGDVKKILDAAGAVNKLGEN